MKILCVDVGTGTQDIFLFDSQLDLENGFKLVVPSPTMLVHNKLKEATLNRQAVLLSGVTMGGGPSQWAAEAHAQTGLPIFATPEAARSFNDDLAAVAAMGITVVSDDEALRLPESVLRLELRDFDFLAIADTFAKFSVPLDDLAAVAVAVFDHGNAPPGYSDRQFRFDYLDQRLQDTKSLSAFAFCAQDVPVIMTRLQAVVASSMGIGAPLVVMDTAPAAVLGALFDPIVAVQPRKIVANVGNFHTLAFRLGPAGVEAVFEHHTGLLDLPKLETLLLALAAGTLQHSDIFDDHGHGALVYDPTPLDLGLQEYGVIVTGPRRSLMRRSSLRPYFAVPFGDMMIAGCFGMLAAVADLMPELQDTIQASLHGAGGSGTPPWEVD